MSERFKPKDQRTLNELLEIEDRMNGTAEGDFWAWRELQEPLDEPAEGERRGER